MELMGSVDPTRCQNATDKESMEIQDVFNLQVKEEICVLIQGESHAYSSSRLYS